MNSANLTRAKQEVYQLVTTGPVLTFAKPATKDKFGEALTQSTQTLNAFPVRFNPFDRRIANKISWSSEVDMIAYCSKKQMDDVSLTIEQMRRYNTISFSGKRYEIKYVDGYSAFKDDFLYVIVGAKK
jgi:hypothetical protein